MDTKKNITDKQLALDKRYIRMAQIWAENSYCQRRKVGALIVKDKMIISDGYNGTPAGFENCCEDENGHTFPFVLHAEANAIISASREQMLGGTLYICCTDPADGAVVPDTCSCMMCKRMIINAGIATVIIRDTKESYRRIETADWVQNDDSLSGRSGY